MDLEGADSNYFGDVELGLAGTQTNGLLLNGRCGTLDGGVDLDVINSLQVSNFGSGSIGVMANNSHGIINALILQPAVQ